MNKSPKPEDILPDGIDKTTMQGKIVRKGTIAAFLANADIFQDAAASIQEKEEALKTMKELATAVIAIGLHKHVIFKNEQVEKILVDAAAIFE